MSPTLTFSRTYVRYEDDGHRLDLPVEWHHVEPDVLTVDANHVDRWDSPPGEPIDPARRDSVLAFVRDHLRASGATFTLDDDEYQRARRAPFRVTLEGTADAPRMRYVRGDHVLEVPARLQPTGPVLCRTSGVTCWTEPAGEALSAADLAAVQREIRSIKPHFAFE